MTNVFVNGSRDKTGRAAYSFLVQLDDSGKYYHKCSLLGDDQSRNFELSAVEQALSWVRKNEVEDVVFNLQNESAITFLNERGYRTNHVEMADIVHKLVHGCASTARKTGRSLYKVGELMDLLEYSDELKFRHCSTVGALHAYMAIENELFLLPNKCFYPALRSLYVSALGKKYNLFTSQDGWIWLNGSASLTGSLSKAASVIAEISRVPERVHEVSLEDFQKMLHEKYFHRMPV